WPATSSRTGSRTSRRWRGASTPGRRSSTRRCRATSLLDLPRQRGQQLALVGGATRAGGVHQRILHPPGDLEIGGGAVLVGGDRIPERDGAERLERVVQLEEALVLL